MFMKAAVIFSGMLFGYWLIDDFNPADIKGKRVFITGASAGIGEQLAYKFCEYGASVVITARRQSKLKEVTDMCRHLGDKEQTHSYIVADMMDLDCIENVVESAVKTLSGLDIIVLNHVFYLPLNVWAGSKQNLSSIKQVMTVNFESYIHLASFALPHLEKSNGIISLVNSFAGKVGQPYFALYSSAKFALNGFFNALRQELHIQGSFVSITQSVLGLVETESIKDRLITSGLKPVFEYAGPVTAEETAFMILKSSVKRERELVFPRHLYLQLLFRDWIPDAIEAMQCYLYTFRTVI